MSVIDLGNAKEMTRTGGRHLVNAVHRQTPQSDIPTASLSQDRALPAALILFPIGAWSGSLVLDVASHAANRPETLVRGALWLVSVGDVAALLAALVGLLAALTTPPRGGAYGAEWIRMTAIVATTAAFIANLFWRYATYPDLHSPVGPLLLSAASLTVLGIAGWAAATLRRRHTGHLVVSAARARRSAGLVPAGARTALACRCEHAGRAVWQREDTARPGEAIERGREAVERPGETVVRRRRRLAAGRLEFLHRATGRAALPWPVRRAEPGS